MTNTFRAKDFIPLYGTKSVDEGKYSNRIRPGSGYEHLVETYQFVCFIGAVLGPVVSFAIYKSI